MYNYGHSMVIAMIWCSYVWKRTKQPAAIPTGRDHSHRRTQYRRRVLRHCRPAQLSRAQVRGKEAPHNFLRERLPTRKGAHDRSIPGGMPTAESTQAPKYRAVSWGPLEDGSDLPVLVMEFLHCTLSECVDRYGVLPEQVGTGILDDVATGLCYLHGHRPPIVHRDLSANNVLLSSNMPAKITDLGVAKILNRTLAKMSQMTKCPGTLSYMPPEALRERPSYNAKLDCFSVGVMILHVLCGRWPYPSEPTRVHPRKRNKVIGLTEAERREEYFHQQVRGDHPLLELIRGCLDNDPPQRPDAIRILHRLRQVISQSPPSCGNKMELLNQTQTLKNERRGLSEQLEQLQGECEQLREVSNKVDGLRAIIRTEDEEKRGLSEQLEQSQRELTQSRGRQERLELTHSIDMEQVQCRVRELSTEVEGLRAVVRSKENVNQAKQTSIQARERAIEAKEREKQQAIEAKEREKQQAIQAKEGEKQQAIQAKEIEKQQAIEAKEQVIQARKRNWC